CGLAVAGLWTKAFFIPIVAAAVFSLLWRRKSRLAGLLLISSAVGLVWYATNVLQTGSITGLPETVQAKTSIVSSIRVVPKLDWSNIGSVLRASHIWIGN